MVNICQGFWWCKNEERFSEERYIACLRDIRCCDISRVKTQVQRLRISNGNLVEFLGRPA